MTSNICKYSNPTPSQPHLSPPLNTLFVPFPAFLRLSQSLSQLPRLSNQYQSLRNLVAAPKKARTMLLYSVLLRFLPPLRQRL